MIQKNIQQSESAIDKGKNQQDYNKGTVNTDMMLNDNVFSRGSADVKQKEETEQETSVKKEVYN